MPITGYGEDALCYWALSCRLHEIVGTANAMVLYRPSFGRRGSKPGKASSQFGEFDAIIATDRMIHLVEAKWRGSSEIRKGEIKLRPEQSRRHDIFKAYLEAWWSNPEPEDWEKFRKRIGEELNVGTEKYPVPDAKRQLAKNLEAVLSRLGKQRKEVENVLLYLALAGQKKIPTNEPTGFRLVPIHTGSPDGFVELPFFVSAAG